MTIIRVSEHSIVKYSRLFSYSDHVAYRRQNETKSYVLALMIQNFELDN